MRELFLNTDNNIVALKIFRTIGLIFFIVVLIIIVILLFEKDYDNSIKLLVPLGVLISAFIASFSVMMNMENTNINERKKLYREKIEHISFIVQELFESFDIKNVENKVIDPRKLSHLSILISHYTPELVNDYEELTKTVSRSRNISNNAQFREFEHSSEVLKNRCETLQMKLKEEIKKYL